MAYRTVDNLHINRNDYMVNNRNGQSFIVQMTGPDIIVNSNAAPDQKKYYDLLLANKRAVGSNDWVVYELWGHLENKNFKPSSRTHFFDCKEEAMDVFKNFFRAYTKYEFGSKAPSKKYNGAYTVDSAVVERSIKRNNSKKGASYTEPERNCSNGYCQIDIDSQNNDTTQDEEKYTDRDSSVKDSFTLTLGLDLSNDLLMDDDESEFSMSELQDHNDLRDDESEDNFGDHFFSTTNSGNTDSFFDPLKQDSTDSDFSGIDQVSVNSTGKENNSMFAPVRGNQRIADKMSLLANQMTMMADAFKNITLNMGSK